MNSGVNVLRAGQPGQPDDRPGGAAGRPQRRRRPAGRGRPRGARQPRQAQLLLRRGRGRLAVHVAGRQPRRSPPTTTRSRCSPARVRAASSTSWPATPTSWPTRSPRACAPRTIPKLVLGFDCVLVVGPEHAPGVRRGRLGPRARCSPSCTTACRFMAASSFAAPAAWPRACPSGLPDETLGKFRPDGLLLVHAGGGAGLFSAMHRRLGQRLAPAPSRSPRKVVTMTRLLLDPTSERTVLRALAAATPGVAARQDDRSARHLQAARQRVPRPAEQRLTELGADGHALQEADVHQAGAGRPAPRDRHPVRRW